MGGALIGIYLNRVLPPEHVKNETRQAVNIAIGLISTLAALVLGLMVASAKSSFDARAADLREIATHIIILDRTLRDYGQATTDARDQLKKTIEARLQRLWAEESETAGAPQARRDGIGLSRPALGTFTRERRAEMVAGSCAKCGE